MLFNFRSLNKLDPSHRCMGVRSVPFAWLIVDAKDACILSNAHNSSWKNCFLLSSLRQHTLPQCRQMNLFFSEQRKVEMERDAPTIHYILVPHIHNMFWHCVIIIMQLIVWGRKQKFRFGAESVSGACVSYACVSTQCWLTNIFCGRQNLHRSTKPLTWTWTHYQLAAYGTPIISLEKCLWWDSIIC